MANDDGQCGECHSTNLKVVSIRDVQRPARDGDPQDIERPVVARKVQVRCRRCGWSDFILPGQLIWAGDFAEDLAVELRVHKVQQAASGGSHVTIYEAEVVLIPGDLEVQVVGVQQEDAEPGVAEAATEAIRRGAEQVLQPLGLGAIIRVGRIVLHPVDFKPRRFEQCTAEELHRLLAETGGPASPGAMPES